METNQSSAEELKTIRKMMEESTKFLSLSGLSGLFPGLFAIAGAVVVWFMVLDSGNISYAEASESIAGKSLIEIKIQLVIVAMSVLFLSLASAFYFSYRNARQTGRSMFTPVARRLLVSLLIPLAAGGLLAIILLVQNQIQLIIPVFLIFYGLSLVNAGKFTYNEIFYLGILEIITGLISTVFPAQGLLFWVVGFGILHIVYGIMMYRKYEV